jgi:glycosyltransferase involved in cell wall biosynthesis
VIAISAPVKGHLEKDLGVAPQRIALIHSGVDTERFGKEVAAGEREMIKRDIGLGPGPVIGTVGRLSDVKGQAVLVEAVAYLEAENRTVQCIIMGDGPEEGNLRRLIRSFGLEKTVHLVRSRPDTAGMLQAMDIFVLPSLKEGLGLSLLEAFASGKACIASDVGGISDIVKDGENGMLFPVGDAKVLGRAIARLLDDEKLRGELGSSAKALAVERFSIGTMAEKTISLYEETLEEYRKT